MKRLMTLTSTAYFLWIIVAILFFTNNKSVSATNFTSVMSGSFTNTATWGGLGVPSSTTDTIIISSGDTVKLAAATTLLNGSVWWKSLIINAGGVLDNNGFPLTFSNSGNSYPYQAIINGEYTGTGTTTWNGIDYIAYNLLAGTGTISTDGLWTLNCIYTEVDSAASLTFTGNSNITVSDGKTLTCFGKLTMANGGIRVGVSSSQTFLYIGSASKPIGRLTLTKGNITMGNFGKVVNYSTASIGGNVTGGSPAIMGWYNLDNATLNIGGGFGTGYVNSDEIGNIVNYNGSSSQSVKITRAGPGGFPSPYFINYTYHHLKCSNAGIKTLAARVIVKGNLVIRDTAQLDAASANYPIDIKGDWLDSSIVSDPFVERAGTITFRGDSAQKMVADSIKTEIFYNLTLNDTGNVDNDLNTVTMHDSLTVKDTLSLIDGVLNLNTHLLTLIKPNAEAIIGGSDTAYIQSETFPPLNYSFVDWRIGSGVGDYLFPLGKSGAVNNYIPVLFNITNTGDNAGIISVATYSTPTANIPYPTSTGMNLNRNGIDNSANTVDRFWIINANYATTAPTVTFTLTAIISELNNVTIPQAQRWNSITNLWEFPLPNQTYSITATGVSVSVPDFKMISSPWTMADNNHLLSTKPLVTHTPNTTICFGTSVNLTASGSNAVYYSWSPTSSLTSLSLTPIANPTLSITNYHWGNFSGYPHVIATPTITTTYTLIISNNSGLDTSYITVIVPEPIIAIIQSPNGTICLGANYQLQSKNNINTPAFYSWSPTTGLSNATIYNPVATPTTATSYSLTIVDSYGCYANAGSSVTITIIPALQVNVGNNLTICSGINTTINTTITSGSTIVWNPATGLTSNTINSPTLNLPTLQLLNYSITVSNPGCLDETDYLSVQVLQSPQLITSNVTICVGTIPTITASGADNYLWSDNTTTSSFSPLISTSTNYTVLGTNNNGCADTSSVQVNVNNLPNVNAGDNITASTGKQINLNGSGASIYSWSPSTNLSQNDIYNPEIKTRVTQQYNLIGTDGNGCANSDSVYIKYIVCDEVFVPDAFSPNGDEQNDQLKIIVEDSECIKTLNFQIYDRWGNKVFESNSPEIKWDGKYLGQDLTDAVFVYRIDIKNVDDMELTEKGNVSLIR